MYCLVEAEGPTKVVTIDTQPLLSPEAAVLDGDVGATERYAFSLTRLGVSLLDHSPRELIFVSAQGVLVERVVSDALLNLECSFASLQVDNMLDATQQPVMLRANPQAHAISPCAFHASALKLRRYTSLHYFRHISFFLQELDVALDWQVTGRHRHNRLLHHCHPHLTPILPAALHCRRPARHPAAPPSRRSRAELAL